MADQPAPNALALARHLRPCVDEGPPFAELHALAGKYDRYPIQEASAPVCPVCGAALQPLTVYCSRVCHTAAYKLAYRDGAKRRQPDELAGYSFPVPRK